MPIDDLRTKSVTRLPTVMIEGRPYFMDERLREYRAVDNPHDRIPMVDTLLQVFDDTAQHDEDHRTL